MIANKITKIIRRPINNCVVVTVIVVDVTIDMIFHNITLFVGAVSSFMLFLMFSEFYPPIAADKTYPRMIGILICFIIELRYKSKPENVIMISYRIVPVSDHYFTFFRRKWWFSTVVSSVGNFSPEIIKII